jgi:hypothetical protein
MHSSSLLNYGKKKSFVSNGTPFVGTCGKKKSFAPNGTPFVGTCPISPRPHFLFLSVKGAIFSVVRFFLLKKNLQSWF